MDRPPALIPVFTVRPPLVVLTLLFFMTSLLGWGFELLPGAGYRAVTTCSQMGTRRVARGPPALQRRSVGAQDARQADVDLARDQSRDRPDARAGERQLLAHLAPQAVRDCLAHVFDASLRGRAAHAEHLADLVGGHPLDEGQPQKRAVAIVQRRHQAGQRRLELAAILL